MKAIIFCSALILASLSAQPLLEEKSSENEIEPSNSSGWFFGVGLGGGIERLESIWKPNPKISNKTFGIFIASAKIGGYYSFNQWVSTRYYYNFDLSFNPGQPNNSPRQLNVPGIGDVGFYMFAQSHTLNTDFLFNFYTNDDKAFGVILGLGIGASVPQFGVRKGFRTWDIDNASGYVIDFQARINSGFRWAFSQKYALELIAKVPISHKTLINPQGTNQKLIKFDPALNLTLDFVMQM